MGLQPAVSLLQVTATADFPILWEGVGVAAGWGRGEGRCVPHKLVLTCEADVSAQAHRFDSLSEADLDTSWVGKTVGQRVMCGRFPLTVHYPPGVFSLLLPHPFPL